MKNTVLSGEEIQQEIIKIDKLVQNLSGYNSIFVQKRDEHKQRPLWLLMADNSAESICLYCYMIKKKIPFLLVDKIISEKRFQEIVDNFQPVCLFLPKQVKHFSCYRKQIVYEEYICWGVLKENIWKKQSISEEVALLLSTSGSTGSSKYVVLTYSNLASNAAAIVKSLEMKKGVRSAVMLPISYSYGLSVINSTLKADGMLLIPDGMLIQKAFWDFLESEKVNIIYGVPYTYDVLRKLQIWRRPLLDLQLITQAGGAMCREMKEFLLHVVEDRREKGMKMDLAIMYGQTEATARMSCFFLNRYPHKINSVGKAVPGGTFSIANPDTEGQGEILYIGENVSSGYATGCNDLSAEMIYRNDNMNILQTGDIGKVDADGFLYITGRKCRFVKQRGYRISLDELQEKMCEILGRDVACVNGLSESMDKIGVLIEKYEIGEDRKKNTECITGYLDEDIILETVRKSLESRFILRNDYTISIIKSLPRKSNGKIDYKKVQELIFEGRSDMRL